MDWLEKPGGGSHRFAKFPLFAIADTRLKDRERRVLAVLCVYANTDGQCKPSRKTIAAYAGISKIEYISEATKSLEKHGWLKKVVNRGAGHSNNYQLTIPAEAIAMADAIKAKLNGEDDEINIPNLGGSKVPNLGGVKVPNLGTLTNQEQTIEQTNIKPMSASADVSAVFGHWKLVMESPRSILDDKRKTVISKRLKDGYTVDDLMLAIDGCRNSEFHMGKNDKGAKYNGVELIFRDAGKVEHFINMVNAKPHKTATEKFFEAINGNGGSFAKAIQEEERDKAERLAANELHFAKQKAAAEASGEPSPLQRLQVSMKADIVDAQFTSVKDDSIPSWLK